MNIKLKNIIKYIKKYYKIYEYKDYLLFNFFFIIHSLLINPFDNKSISFNYILIFPLIIKKQMIKISFLIYTNG